MKNFSYELFKVASITRATPTKSSMYTLLDPEGKLVDHQFLRQDILLVDEKSLIKELQRSEYIVEAVLDKKMVRGKPKYLLRWYGYGPDEDTWESPQPSFQALIDQYELEHGKPTPTTKEPSPTSITPNKSASNPINLPKPTNAMPKKKPRITLSRQLDLAAAEGAQTTNTGRVTRSRSKK